ncbi:MAG: excinuclease ABC subunit UvrC [Mariprofundaceae bacterium]|nr:excinuclease ABC subunit UvrC [Mariprofundaceae bacterium]
MNLSLLPTDSGCYLFKDKHDRIIYVGKAKVLKKRVSSYFQKRNHDAKTRALVEHIVDLDFIVTANELEALLLENHLIKKHQPKYNIALKDSGGYSYLCLSDELWPRLLVRQDRDLAGKYFGPFTSTRMRDHLYQALQRIFKLRTCHVLPKRACLRYHMDLCDAPCVEKITATDYQKQVNAAEEVLCGRSDALIADLETEMKSHAVEMAFEKALSLRHQIEALRRLQEKQHVQRDKTYDEDVIHYKQEGMMLYIMLFHVKKGMLDEKKSFCFDAMDDAFESFLAQYYQHHSVPKDIILAQPLSKSLHAFLEMKRKAKVCITVPQRGEKKHLLALVQKNIEHHFFGSLKKLEDLQDKLGLAVLPCVIECFDISHFQGHATVASMVQFRDGRADKKQYRRYKIRHVEGIDDFRSMAEVVSRRYGRLLDEKKAMPDLIVIDGGAGQLSFAQASLLELGLDLPIVSLAKRHEEIYMPETEETLRLHHQAPALHLMQQIRDEAHRFAIQYHRQLRKRTTGFHDS